MLNSPMKLLRALRSAARYFHPNAVRSARQGSAARCTYRITCRDSGHRFSKVYETNLPTGIENDGYCRNQKPVNYWVIVHDLRFAHRITRSSPARRVTCSRSRYSSRGIAYLRVIPFSSLKTGTEIRSPLDFL